MNETLQTHWSDCWREPGHHACAIRRIEQLEAQLTKRDAPCVWKFDSDVFEYVSCTGDWFDERMKFCPDCGHPVQRETHDNAKKRNERLTRKGCRTMNEKTVRMITEAEEEMRNAERTVKDQILDLEREIEVADRRNAALNTRLTDALDRAMQAERDASVYAERAERAEAALAAVPWQALLNISHALEASDAASDSDEAALLAFLNRYAPWVPA